MSFVLDTLAMFTCMSCAFGFGWVFFLHYLFKNYECHHRGAQIIFASVFSLSFSLLVLIIFEILDYMDRDSRKFHWNLNLFLILLEEGFFIKNDQPNLKIKYFTIDEFPIRKFQGVKLYSIIYIYWSLLLIKAFR